MKGNRIFREELPGEKKSIINLVLTGYLVSISCMGYVAFYLFVQLTQVKKILGAMERDFLTTDQFNLLKDRLMGSLDQIGNDMLWLAGIGTVVCVVGGVYTFNLLIRPLRKLIDYTNSDARTEPPEFKSNHELKQLATAISDLSSRLTGPRQKQTR